jgi:hypothetical protein
VTELQYLSAFDFTGANFVATSMALVAVIEGAGGCDGIGLVADTTRAMAKHSPIVIKVIFMTVVFLANV